MVRWWMVLCALLVLGVAATADTLYLNDGRVLVGELCGVTAYSLLFCVAGGRPSTFLLTEVLRVELDFGANPNPRVTEAEWRRAMSRAQRELTACRSARVALVLGGLAFVAGGHWLGVRGHEAGSFILGLGAVVAGLGLIAPTPRCPIQEERVKVLTRIGLDHGWLY